MFSPDVLVAISMPPRHVTLCGEPPLDRDTEDVPVRDAVARLLLCARHLHRIQIAMPSIFQATATSRRLLRMTTTSRSAAWKALQWLRSTRPRLRSHPRLMTRPCVTIHRLDIDAKVATFPNRPETLSTSNEDSISDDGVHCHMPRLLPTQKLI